MGSVPGPGQSPSIPLETRSAAIYWENCKKPHRWDWKCSRPGACQLCAGAVLYSPSVAQVLPPVAPGQRERCRAWALCCGCWSRGSGHNPPPRQGCGRGVTGCSSLRPAESRRHAAPHKLFSQLPGGRILAREGPWLPLQPGEQDNTTAPRTLTFTKPTHAEQTPAGNLSYRYPNTGSAIQRGANRPRGWACCTSPPPSPPAPLPLFALVRREWGTSPPANFILYGCAKTGTANPLSPWQTLARRQLCLLPRRASAELERRGVKASYAAGAIPYPPRTAPSLEPTEASVGGCGLSETAMCGRTRGILPGQNVFSFPRSSQLVLPSHPRHFPVAGTSPSSLPPSSAG